MVVQGELAGSQSGAQGGVFRVSAMGLPPAEYRQTSLRSLGLLDTFNAGMRQQQFDDMLALEQSAETALMVVLSDLKLDRPLVLQKLQQVLAGFEANGVDPLFVLIGSFQSKPVARMTGGRGLCKATFAALADVIASCPRLAARAKFLLLPGPNDPGCSVALPRRAIPAEFTEALRHKVRHIAFGSNPFRVRYYTREVVFFREDLLKKMQRHLATSQPTNSNSNSIRRRARDGDDIEELDLEEDVQGSAGPEVTEQLVESLLDQAHLFPLPAAAKPVTWGLDHAMRLFPLPDILVLADHADNYQYDYKGCTALNPGSFSSDFSFVVYSPAAGSIEFSRVPT